MKANTKADVDIGQFSLNDQMYPEDTESHKIINHPVHILDNTLGHLSPSSFIPFCDFAGNPNKMGIKIEQFYSPICNSFNAKILNDQLCYEVDPNRFIDQGDPESMSKGLTIFIDTNLERQYPKSKGTGLLSSFNENNTVTVFILFVGLDFMIYLNTLGRFTSLFHQLDAYLCFHSSIKALWKWKLCPLSSEGYCCNQKFSITKQQH